MMLSLGLTLDGAEDEGAGRGGAGLEGGRTGEEEVCCPWGRLGGGGGGGILVSPASSLDRGLRLIYA